jgi:ribose 5-phosphate isomerase B
MNTLNYNIYIASDHAGVELKEQLIKALSAEAVSIHDLGPATLDSVDYPDYAHHLCNEIKNSADFGILVCGSGIGMSIAANRLPHIRAALCRTVEDAKLSRQHNNANVLCLGALVTNETLALEIVKAFIVTCFEGGRHQQRIDKINH